MIELAKVNNPTAGFKVMDCRKIEKLQRKFDGIVCGFCFPYLSEFDCSKLIKDCHNLLKGNGVLYISFVEGDYVKSGFLTRSSGDRTFFYFHKLDSLTKVLTNNKFEIINKNYKKSLEIEEVQTIIIGRK